MFNNVVSLLPEIVVSMGQTFFMVGVSVGMAILIGTPLGVYLFLTNRGQLMENKIIYHVLNDVVNLIRSFPFIILLVVLIPFTRLIIGTTVGPAAASVSLSIAAIPYFARLVEQALRDVPKGTMEAAIAMGASKLQIVWSVLLNEARSGLILSVTVTTISFISYSAIAGVVGGGGIGDLAIRFGYYRFQTDVMVVTVLILILLVQVIQFLGNKMASTLDKRS